VLAPLRIRPMPSPTSIWRRLGRCHPRVTCLYVPFFVEPLSCAGPSCHCSRRVVNWPLPRQPAPSHTYKALEDKTVLTGTAFEATACTHPLRGQPHLQLRSHRLAITAVSTPNCTARASGILIGPTPSGLHDLLKGYLLSAPNPLASNFHLQQ
jgi:hypothetical protein